MKTILITGEDGQLAQCLKLVESTASNFQFIYRNAKDLDITNQNAVNTFFKSNKIDYCINCAAYTAVDDAETNPLIAKKVNTDGPKYLAIACKFSDTILVHISTDFIFDGKKRKPYTEIDKTNPLGVYGLTKRDGENEIKNHWQKYYIIRTSWLYSQFGTNFLKTMLRLSKEKHELYIVKNQIGSPTYALDLANAIIKIITSQSKKYGIYNYANLGAISWYEFAELIFKTSKISIKTHPILAEAYTSKAKRPLYSVLNTKKIEANFDVLVPEWKTSLITCLKYLATKES